MSAGPRPIDGLCTGLSYDFSRLELLDIALTHASAASSTSDSYERLEFLGDRVLGLIVADLLMRRYPNESEGSLARRYSVLVDRNSLAEVAGPLELGEYLRLNPGESAAGIRDNRTVLADVMEAVLGAIYRDGGFDAVKPVVERLWRPLVERDTVPPVDPKTALQELVQGRGVALPEYRVVDRTGPDHQPNFVVEVSVRGHASARGEGPSKQAAERVAAQRLLNDLHGETLG